MPRPSSTESTEPRAGSALVLPASVRSQLAVWTREGFPDEACGLLIGRELSASRAEVERAVRCRNLSHERARDRYELDPLDHLRAEQEAQAAGLAVVGVWHTHPDHPACPSETDRVAAYEGWSYVILAVGPGGVNEVRSWRLRAGEFQEEALEPDAAR